MIWLWIYDPLQGVLNQILGVFNIKGREWLYEAKYALGCIIVMSIWKVLGYNLIVYLAGLQGIPWNALRKSLERLHPMSMP